MTASSRPAQGFSQPISQRLGLCAALARHAFTLTCLLFALVPAAVSMPLPCQCSFLHLFSVTVPAAANNLGRGCAAADRCYLLLSVELEAKAVLDEPGHNGCCVSCTGRQDCLTSKAREVVHHTCTWCCSDTRCLCSSVSVHC